MNQRPDFAEAKRYWKDSAWWTCESDFWRKYTHSSCTTITTCEGTINSKELKNKIIKSILEQDGGLIFLKSQGNLFVLVNPVGIARR